jgi:hypothetical protein
MTEDDKILLRRIAAMPYEAEYDVGVGVRTAKLIKLSHDGVMPSDVRPLALKGWVALSDRTERFAQSPRHVLVAKITAMGRHAAGLSPPPRVRKHRPEPVTEEA